CYQHNDLVGDRMSIAGQPVHLGRVTAAVLRISGRRDVVTPPHQAARREHLPAAAGFAALHVPAGHVGLLVGPTAPQAMYDPLGRWLHDRSA
ncbi:MAG TPA: hypothetical protein VK891_17110, partial [Euzebyales bacterium]|nr:hypothetical protein [Euzebyales bacterium]